MEFERFQLPGGEEVGTGLLIPGPEQKAMAAAAPVYGEEFYLDSKDIERALKGDVYKTFRRLRQPYMMNQGGLGSCNAQAAINAFHNRRMLDGLAWVPLSPNYVYMNINGGRDGGSMLADSLAFSAKGVAPRRLKLDGREVVFPNNVYNKRQISAQLLREAAVAASTFQSHEAYKLPVDDYATFKIALASALARDHQVVHAWHVGRASMNLRNGYIVVGNGPGNHATLWHSAKWVGGEDLVHPDVENSWGPTVDPILGPLTGGWGDGGFGSMTMQDAYRCHAYHDYWVFPSNKMNNNSLRKA